MLISACAKTLPHPAASRMAQASRPVLALDLSDAASTTSSIWARYPNGRVDTTLLGRHMFGAASSPDGRTVAASFSFSDSARGHLAVIVRENGSADTLTVAAPGWRVGPAWPAWSPSGDEIAFMVGGESMQTFGRLEIAIVNLAQRAVTRRAGARQS